MAVFAEDSKTLADKLILGESWKKYAGKENGGELRQYSSPYTSRL